MRIGMDARYAFRAERRGIGEYVAQLLTNYAAVDSSHEFHLYIDHGADESTLPLPAGRFFVHRLDVQNPLLFEEVHLPRAASRDHLDLLHFTSNYGASLPPCATVYTIHDVIEFLRSDIGEWRIDWRHELGRAVRKRTLHWQARRARKIVTPSKASKVDIVRVLGVDADDVVVIPHGAPENLPAADPAVVRESLRARGYSVADRYLLAFAALDPRKNIDIVVRAFRQVRRNLPHVELWLVGIEDLARYHNYNLPGIHMFGYLPKTDAVDLLIGARSLVYPSVYEGFGLPALEAMAAGVPVVASDATSLPEVVGDAGILFPPTDEGKLIEAMQVLLQSDERAQDLRRRGLERAQLFSWRKAALSHLSTYEAAVEGVR